MGRIANTLIADAAVSDRQQLRRFEIETRAVAALNHSNNLAAYDIVESAARNGALRNHGRMFTRLRRVWL